MKIYVKKNEYTFKGAHYSREILLRVEDKCDCIENVEYEIKPNIDADTNAEFDDVKIRPYLVFNHMETDVDYDYEENAIYTDYEEATYIQFNFCPICGDKIEVIVEETVDLTEQLKPLLEERESLDKQRYSMKRTKRLFEVLATNNNDEPIKLPILCLRRKPGLNVINTNKKPLTFDGMRLEADSKESTVLNAIPIDIQYQVDIYTRYFKEADEFLRNLTFNIINYPKLTVQLPYHDMGIEHYGIIRMSNNIDDNSSIPERLINGQFTRLTFNVSIDDAYLWNIKKKDNVSIVDVEVYDSTNVEQQL